LRLQTGDMMRKRWGLAAIILVATATLVFWSVGRTPPYHLLHLKTYLTNAQGLQAGAEVRIAGVVVGKVTDVRVRTDLPENPAEVSLLLQTSYDLRLPADSVVLLETAGILGGVFLEISIKGANGPPVGDNATLKAISSSTPSLTAEQILTRLSSLVDQKLCDPARPKSASTPARIKR